MSLLIRASNLLSMGNMKVSLYFYRDPGNTIATQFPNRDIKCRLIWPRGYKTFFKLSSVEHEISDVHKCLYSQT